MLYNRIHFFLETADTLNFTAAAKNLHVTQQAVTKQIAALEEELGVRLFERTTRSVSLTPAGQVLRNDFIKINRQIEESIEKVKKVNAAARSQLTVGIYAYFSQKHITIPFMDQLQRFYPRVFFDLHLLNFEDLRHQLFDHKLDFCFTTSNDWKSWPHVRVDVLQTNQFQIVCSASHPITSNPDFKLDDLENYPMLLHPRGHLMPNTVNWAKKIKHSQIIQCPDVPTMLIRLVTGQGFALLTRIFEGFDSDSLFFYPVPFPEAHSEIICIRPDDSDAFTEQVCQTIRHFIFK